MYKTGSEARQKYEVTPCWRGEHDAEGCSGSWRLRRTPLRPTSPPALLPLLGPELDRLLPSDLLAALPLSGRLRLEQRRLAGDQFAGGELQGLGVAAVANRFEIEHLTAIADPALPGRERWPLPFTNVHGEH